MTQSRTSIRLELRLLDTGKRTVEASLSSDAPVQFPDGVQVLSHEPGAVDLSRAATGLPLLFAHDQSEPIGLVVNVRLEGGKLKGTLRFGSSAKAKEVMQDVIDGVLPYMSVGLRFLAPPTPIEGGFLITKWMPYEASVVSVPADATVGIGRSYPQEGNTMPTNTNPAPAETQDHDDEGELGEAVEQRRLRPREQRGQTREFLSHAERLLTNFDGRRDARAFLDQLQQRNLPLSAMRSAVFAELARRSDELQIRGVSSMPEVFGGGGAADIHSPEGRVAAYAEVLAARCGGPAPGEAVRQFNDLRCVDMARDLLEIRGIRTTNLSKSEIITRSMNGTADFPQLLAGAGNRVLRRAYDSYKGGLRRACRQSTARDFRAKQSLALSEAPTLEKVNEFGEFKRTGKMSETVDSYKLSSFGKIFGITRQALVNDDLDAFGQMNQKFGVAAAEFESLSLVALLASNPTMGDGTALFHASHGNLAAGAAALDTTTLGAGRYALRMQKGIDGKTPIDVAGKYVIVPAALEMKMDQALIQVPGADIGSKANLFAGLYEKIVDPRLDAYSAVNWYMSADPDLFDTIEYSYLQDNPGPQFSTREGFDVDGLELKVLLDFGSGVLDFRGLYKGIST